MKKVIIITIIFLLINACDTGQSLQNNDNNSDQSNENNKDTTNETLAKEKNNQKDAKELKEDKKEGETKTIGERDNSSVAVREFTYEEKQLMTQTFFDWAVERAKIADMAVTTRYFSHGSGGIGDWYALTPDGEVQTQNQNDPGFGHFKIHAIGGVAFYQPVSGDYGVDENAPNVGIAEGYSRLAVPDTYIHKYMLADNGVVYELIAKRENMSFSTGFGEYSDDGTTIAFKPTVQFEVSEDEDAQQKWREILKNFKNK